MSVLTVCSCVLRVKDQLGMPLPGAELIFEPRKTQVNASDAVYVSRPERSLAAPGIVIQDLLYISKSASPTTTISVTYTGGGTAGAELVTVNGTAITVQIQSGVSTATQIRTAVIASVAATALVYTILSGVGSNTQVSVSVTNLSDDYCYLALAETTTNTQLCVFVLNWDDPGKASGSIIFDPIQIPNQSFKDLSSLLTASRG